MARTIASGAYAFGESSSPQETINDDFSQLEKSDIPNGMTPDAFIIMMEAAKKSGHEFVNKEIEYSIIEQRTDKETAESFRYLDETARTNREFGSGWGKSRIQWLNREIDRFNRAKPQEYPDPKSSGAVGV